MAQTNQNNQENKQGIVYIGNAFSTRMMSGDGDVHIRTISEKEFKEVKYVAHSIVGHPDTANVLGVEMNRESVTLKEGDVLYVAELKGGHRLPEGATRLPTGFEFKYKKIWVEYVEAPPIKNVEKVDAIYDFNKNQYTLSYKVEDSKKKVNESYDNYDEFKRRRDKINAPIFSLEKTENQIKLMDIYPCVTFDNIRYHQVLDGGRYYENMEFDAHVGRYDITDISSGLTGEEYLLDKFEETFIERVLMKDKRTIQKVFKALDLDDDNYFEFIFEDDFIRKEPQDIRRVIDDITYEYDVKRTIKEFLWENWDDDCYLSFIDDDY